MDEQMIKKLSGELSKIILEAYEQGRKDALLGKKECNKSEDKVMPACSLTASQLEKMWAEDERYSDFRLLDKPKKFSELFWDVDIEEVSVYSTETYFVGTKKYLVGYCGSFSWLNNEIKPLDYDSYNKNMTVLGYYSYGNVNEQISLFVGNDW